MSVNTSFSVLHFSENDIVDRADKLGVSLGDNGREVAISINELLDLEADRAMNMLKNIAAIKPMEESAINELGVRELEYMCEDLVPTSLLDALTLEVEEHAAPLQPTEGLGNDLSHAGCEIVPDKPKRTRQKKVCPFCCASEC